MYTKIKKFWEKNKDELLPEFERNQQAAKDNLAESAMEGAYNPISEEQILQIASEVDMNDLRKQVLDLYGVDYSATTSDVSLFFEKMEAVF